MVYTPPWADWVRKCFGDPALHKIAVKNRFERPRWHHVIICSGFIFGNPAGFTTLGNAYASTPCRDRIKGIDQGLLNYCTHARTRLQRPQSQCHPT